MTTILERHLVKSIATLHNGADDYDVIFEVGEEPNIKVFRAHSVILRAVSPYFKVALSKRWTGESQDRLVFKKPNIDPNVFSIILKYRFPHAISKMVLSLNPIINDPS
jgi:hypothetical protein